MLLQTEEVVLQGTPISPGVAIGIPFFFTYIDDDETISNPFNANPNLEIARYQQALQTSLEEVSRLQIQLEIERALEAAAILDAQQQMLKDPLLTTHVEDEIRRTEKNAEYVFMSLIRQYQKKFSRLADPLFQDRFKDIQDISRRVLGHLKKRVRVSLADVPRNSIIFAKELTASDTAEAHTSNVYALVTAAGGITSHAAIVAKAKGIPYVAINDYDRIESFKPSIVVVDGRTGEIILNPIEATKEKYVQLIQQQLKHRTRLEKVGFLAAETYDGYQVKLSANIEVVTELELLSQYGGHGIGLFRSEYIFLSKKDFPTEEEQFDIYRTLVEKMNGLPVVIRTFDISGDKLTLSHAIIHEWKSLLECRTLKFLLKRPAIFKIQLRAILRASAYGNVHILFPMITSLSELREAKVLLAEAKEELISLGIPVSQSVPVGCMIEVPSAALITDLLAAECDFFSIGTNDLVQFALAIDRSDQVMNEISNQTHPAVIRFIKLVVNIANQYGIPVSLCGEMASDPRFTSLLYGLGIHELSVALRYIPVIKNAIRHMSIVEASVLAEKALELQTGQEIIELLSQAYQKSLPEIF